MKPLKIIAKLLIILLVFSLVSCDENIFSDYADDSSDEAQLEAALIYLDDGEYSKAKAILETLDQSDPEVKRALASAYAGLAGLDIPSLIAAVDDTAGNSALQAVGNILGDADNDNKLTISEVNSKLDNVSSAISLYDDLEKTDSVKAQLCILYATRIILFIGKEYCEDNSNEVNLNDSTNFSTQSIDGTGYPSGSSYSQDFSYINQYISSIDPDLADGFNDLKNELDNGNGAGTLGDGILHVEEIEYYISNL